MFRAIFWDNDGVLVDTEALYYRANLEILQELDVLLTEALFKECFLIRSVGLPALLPTHCSTRLEELRDLRNARYAELLACEAFEIPGVEETLQALHGRIPMAVVTSSRKDHFEAIHRRTGFTSYFDFVIAHGDYRNSKPEPDPYLAALKRSGLKPEECLVIEDSLRGLRAAKAAGLQCWVLPNRFSAVEEFAEADRLLSSITEIPALLGKTLLSAKP